MYMRQDTVPPAPLPPAAGSREREIILSWTATLNEALELIILTPEGAQDGGKVALSSAAAMPAD